MNDIDLAQTPSTPLVRTSVQDGRLTMAGDSYPENPFEFFQPIIDWIDGFLAKDSGPLACDLALIYLNTSSIRAMMDIFDRLEEAHQGGRQVSVHWSYDPENERVGELAEEFKEDCSFPFTIAPRP
ncbi:biofilm regulation phosphoprotein SiaC [Desulfomicrobium escambiense]|uniref:biofilm regulation phosphoprotein SiaC n=1 Tax=Desulfomicrobium escambiense TaxID=29503 RepID=UPI00048E4CEF|nr:biofilm regulation phosphoprotein SiaC [Desulfomicrobium escambiense]